ncbi:RNA polymerase sigma factor [Parasphingorhabdus pacifica]
MHEIGEVGVSPLLWQRVQQGDEMAWRELVDRNSGVVWAAARVYSSHRADAEDVYQATWLLLAENLANLREPAALPGWLATTARRESLRLARARRREAPVGVDAAILGSNGHVEGPENAALRSATNSRIWQAFAQLSLRCQQLLRVVAMAPDASYAQVSEALGLPRGSIGPKKGRCLSALRQRLATVGIPEEVAG